METTILQGLCKGHIDDFFRKYFGTVGKFPSKRLLPLYHTDSADLCTSVVAEPRLR